MSLRHLALLWFALLCYPLFNQGLLAQNNPTDSVINETQNTPYTFSNYHSLENCINISSKEYPIQIARFPIDRPGFIKKIILHLDGSGKGKFTTHIYGHEGGTNYPALRMDLTPPIRKRKRKSGYQAIIIQLKEPVFVNNDQFYIVLDHFKGDFGLKQDATFYQEYCCAEDGGNYYPSLLKNTVGKFLGENCYLTMDVQMEFIPIVPAIFEEVSQNVGLPLTLSNESIAWGDLDGDNWLDLIVDNRIYKNNKGVFKDITQTISDTIPSGFKGAVFVDLDNNGQQDILFLGAKKSVLYLNTGADTFIQKEINLPPLPALSGFSIADINQDRFPDLLLTQLWVHYPVPTPNYLLLNDGQNNFIDVTQRLYPKHNGQDNFPQNLNCVAGVDTTYFPNHNKNKRSRGSQFTDIDLDGDVDLYITNYFLESDELFLNDGLGYFRSIPAPKPVGQSDTINNHGTGVDWYDFDNDGDFDLLLPQLAHPDYLKKYDHRGTTIFRNDAGEFIDLSNHHGIAYEEAPAGAAFGDVNNDGFADIITTVFYGCRYVDLYLQQPDHRFELSTHQSGLAKITTGNDACFVDFNNDGLLDVAMGEKGKFRLFKNRKKNQNAWIKVQLKNPQGNHFGLGAIVKIYANNQVFTQEVNAGRGQKIQKPSVLHFGLGTATTINKIEVHWSSKQIETYSNCQINQIYTLVKGNEPLFHDK